MCSTLGIVVVFFYLVSLFAGALPSESHKSVGIHAMYFKPLCNLFPWCRTLWIYGRRSRAPETQEVSWRLAPADAAGPEQGRRFYRLTEGEVKRVLRFSKRWSLSGFSLGVELPPAPLPVSAWSRARLSGLPPSSIIRGGDPSRPSGDPRRAVSVAHRCHVGRFAAELKILVVGHVWRWRVTLSWTLRVVVLVKS